MKIKDLLIVLRSPIYRIGLKNYDFSIISNNCWGGVISRDRHLPYNSPTAGLFLFSEDYIKFLENVEYYLSLEMRQISISESKFSEFLKKSYSDDLIIGILDDIELIMLHYSTFDEAKNKWDRRKKRLNYNNLLIKYSDQNLFQPDHLERFNKLPFEHKLFITINDRYVSDNVCFLSDVWGVGFAKDDIKPSFKVINVNRLLNSLKKEG